jgi:hypothetical protein
MKMYKKKILIVSATIGLLAGCASTHITAFKDPDFVGRSFHRILVVAPFSDMEYRDTAEKNFVFWLSQFSIEAISSIQKMPPTRNYSDEDYNKILLKNNIEAVLVITLTDAFTSETYVPGSSRTDANATLMGNYIQYSSQTSQSPGYFISKPRVKFELRLFDVATGKTAWIASSFTKGNALAGFGTLMNSLANNTAFQLRYDGLLRKK